MTTIPSLSVRLRAALIVLVAFCAICLPAAGATITSFAGFTIQVFVDENCGGSIIGFGGTAPLPCSFTQDPGPGGLAGAMTYGLLNPPGLVAGDVTLLESGTITDLIRFDPTVNGGSLFFYSDLDGGKDTLADIGFPTALNNNVVRLNEVNLGPGVFGLVYTPTAGQPGFVGGAAAPVVYTFFSDTPEPATFGLAASAIAFLGILGWRRKSSKVA